MKKQIVTFYCVGFACDLNAHVRYDNIFLLRDLDMFTTQESAAIACIDSVMDFQVYRLPVDTFNEVFASKNTRQRVLEDAIQSLTGKVNELSVSRNG